MANQNKEDNKNMEIEKNKNWISELRALNDYKVLEEKPVAYFSAEYALSLNLPIYAGGLGILAGDIVKDATQNKLPIVFIGLLYKRGQNDIVTNNSISNTEIVKFSENSKSVLISIPISGREIFFQIWHFNKDGARVYLLDTDVPENTSEDRMITDQLYVEDRELRLKQEILLGIGGFRFLNHELGLHPSVYHLNEGHSAFLALELINHEMIHQQTDFKTACGYAKRHILFTNHTLVIAGQEVFSNNSVSNALGLYAKQIGVSVDEILNLGRFDNTDLFSMTMFSFRMSTKANSVSLLHREKASLVWPDYEMVNITNGVDISGWDSIPKVKDLWQAHKENKRKLLNYIKDKTGKDWEEDVLLFGWARRIVPYKQPTAFIKDIERFLDLARDTKRPFRLIFSGPTNEKQKNELLEELKKTINERLEGVVVFLPNYNLEIASLMVSGCDVWLNTPVIGREACGTSGMKAALNGVLPFSTNDGWIAEAEIDECGWRVGEEKNLSKSMLDIVEREIAPMYYESLLDRENSKWFFYMKNSRALILDKFSINRALKEYFEKCYLPILQNKHTHKYD